MYFIEQVWGVKSLVPALFLMVLLFGVLPMEVTRRLILKALITQIHLFPA